jgi:CheY-like chemotaxis protein
VTVPLTDHRPAGEAEVRRRADRDRASDQLPSLGGVRILVVDDEDDGRELVRAVLAQCGAEVTVAATAPAALEALAQASFDVLVSDIAMPEHTGYDLIRHVRALDPERGGRIPALALTAYARIEDREAALSIGYQHHATKPIEPAELAAAVAALARRAARQRRERSESPRAASRSRRQSRPKPRRRPPDHPR